MLLIDINIIPHDITRTGAVLPRPDANALHTMHSIRAGGAVSHLLVSAAAAGTVSLVSRNYAGPGVSLRGIPGLATPIPPRDKESGKVTNRLTTDANELPTLPEFAKLHVQLSHEETAKVRQPSA